MTIDGRTLSHETSETLRLLAVRRVKDGERPSSVIKSYGLCRTTIYKWLKAERRGGEKALKARKHPGPPPALSPEQKLQVRRWINGKDPRQYGFDFGLWTRQIVAALIEQKFGVRLGVTAVGRLLAALDITPQKPLRRAYERDPVAIARWTTEVFPQLRARAKRVHAKIFFLDEAGVRSDQVLGRTWGLARAHPGSPHQWPAPECERHLGGQRAGRLLVRDLHATAQRTGVHRAPDPLHAPTHGPRVPRPRRPPGAHRQGRGALCPESQGAP